MIKAKNKIEQQNFRTIEAELYCFDETLRLLKDLKEEIIGSSTFQDVCVQSSTMGDTTANKAVRLVTSLEIIETERRVRAIQEALSALEKDKGKMELMRLKYFEKRYTDIGIMNKLHISERTFYRWRREIVRMVGNRLGWRV